MISPPEVQRPRTAPLPESLVQTATRLANHRVRRYEGDDVCTMLGALAAEDQRIIQDVYLFLLGFLAVLAPHPVPDEKWPSVLEFARRPDVLSLAGKVRELGDATRRERQLDDATGKAIHDLRGSALAAILGRLEMISASSDVSRRGADDLTRLFILTRDQLKISRNAFVGLDDEKRDDDRAAKMHNISSIISKWEHALPGLVTRNLPVVVNSRYHGNVSECCLESSALDRILHNLIGNACRHCSDDHVGLDILPVPGASGLNLRFIVSNALSPDKVSQLKQLTGGDLGKIFRSGVSTTGSGLGLAIVADFVAEAFGLPRGDRVVQEGYVGALVERGVFFAWFHWPAAKDEF